MTYSWSIWLIDFDPVIGSEQGKIRPAIILGEEKINQILPVLNVLPITSKKERRKIFPNEILLKGGRFGLINDSIVLCYQIRTVDKKRLIKEIVIINEQKIKDNIISSLCFQLGIKI